MKVGLVLMGLVSSHKLGFLTQTTLNIQNSESAEVDQTMKSIAESEQQLRIKYDPNLGKQKPLSQLGLKNAIYEDEEEAETRMTLESAKEAQKEQDVKDSIVNERNMRVA